METLVAVWNRWKVWWLSALAGALLGCAFRFLFATTVGDAESAVYTMTLAFLVVVPSVMGYLSVEWYLNSRPDKAKSVWNWVFLPWVSVFISMAVAVAVKWEGYACLVFAAPIMLFFALIGGITGRVAWARTRKRAGTNLFVSALPIIVLIVESHLPAPWETRTVQTEIPIHAPVAVVWDNIKSVRAIGPGELGEAWVTRIGFPKPVAATLSHDGVGGVRQASFTGGLLFTETVDAWEPGKILRFSIRANTDSLPAATLDEHVKVGGAFFDVLEGEYTMEQTPGGVLLHLASRERLSTHFNLYAGLWSDAVMRSIQEQILEVIRNRSERQAEQFRISLR